LKDFWQFNLSGGISGICEGFFQVQEGLEKLRLCTALFIVNQVVKQAGQPVSQSISW
jgi:hypothetical protein